MKWKGLECSPPFVLFAYTVLVYKSQQKNCLLYLLYGCDPRLPTTLEPDSEQQQQHLTDLNTYKVEVAFKFSEAWKLARDNIYQY